MILDTDLLPELDIPPLILFRLQNDSFTKHSATGLAPENRQEEDEQVCSLSGGSFQAHGGKLAACIADPIEEFGEVIFACSVPAIVEKTPWHGWSLQTAF